MLHTLALAGQEHQHHQHVDGIQNPGFFDLWNIDVFLFSIIVIVVYFQLVGKWRNRFTDAQPVAAANQVYFLIGMLLFVLVKATPLDFYGHHYLFSAHMLQMAIVFLVIPPLLLLGITDWMISPILKRDWSKKTLLLLTHPLVSLVLFNMLFSLYHIPYIFNLLMADHLLHNLYYGVLWLGAVLMWWPLMNISPGQNSMGGLRKIAYLVGNSVLITPVCALIIFASDPLYDSYLNTPQIFAILPTIDDQQLGGVIMKTLQELTYITAVGIIFFQWVKEERQREALVDADLLVNQARAFAAKGDYQGES